MLYPSINELLDKVESRYTLVVVTAQRARQIIDGEGVKVEPSSKKPVSIATQEIFEGKIKYSTGEESD